MIHLALYEPEIPQNTGSIIRLCANMGAHLHLIHPLGFDMDHQRLRRAGLDYHEWAGVSHYDDWSTFKQAMGSRRLFFFTTRATRSHIEPEYQHEDVLVFGPESRGLPQELLDQYTQKDWVRIPMLAHSRSLNLSNAASVGVYEVWRQLGFEA